MPRRPNPANQRMKRMLDESVINGRVTEELAKFVEMMVSGYLIEYQPNLQYDDSEDFRGYIMEHFCRKYQYFAGLPAPASMLGIRIKSRWRDWSISRGVESQKILHFVDQCERGRIEGCRVS